MLTHLLLLTLVVASPVPTSESSPNASDAPASETTSISEGPDFGPRPEPGTAVVALQGVHRDVVSTFPPVRQGAWTVRASSPSQRVVVHRNWLHLLPREDGVLGAFLAVDLEGEGDLVADLEAGALGQRITDEVEIPRQVLRVEGAIRLLRVDEQGVELELVDLPRTMTVQIRSGLVGQLVGLCEGVAIFMPLDCGALDRSLSNLAVDLPERGTVMRIGADNLEPQDLAFLAERFGASVPATP